MEDANSIFTMNSGKLIIKNVDIVGTFTIGCAGCDYCRYSEVVDGVVYDDRGNVITAGTFAN